jgi:CspA family cold shock protein
MNTGTVKFFNEEKGFGFVIDEATKQEFFVHVTGLTEKVKEGDQVTFEITEGKKGLMASNVKKA